MKTVKAGKPAKNTFPESFPAIDDHIPLNPISLKVY